MIVDITQLATIIPMMSRADLRHKLLRLFSPFGNIIFVNNNNNYTIIIIIIIIIIVFKSEAAKYVHNAVKNKSSITKLNQ